MGKTQTCLLRYTDWVGMVLDRRDNYHIVQGTYNRDADKPVQMFSYVCAWLFPYCIDYLYLLKSWKFGYIKSRKLFYAGNSKGTNQTGQMNRLVCSYFVCIYINQVFL